MKHRDLVLIANLRRNARETLSSISRRTNIPVSTIFDRLKLHERTLIKKHTALIDFAKLGFSARAHIILKVHKDDRESLRTYLMASRHVNTVCKINNGYDFLCEAFFRSIHELEEMLEDMDRSFRISTKQVYYIIEELKREEFMADPAQIDLIWDDRINRIRPGSVQLL
jgi:Lrp/AsnC family transcriptional regulator, regulator for asnA, asnC and gidA